MSRKLYAIGDIHGCLTELKQLLKLIEENRGDSPATIVFLGDYVDRGPDSAGCVELVKDLVASSTDELTYIGLMGNHEDMWIEFLEDNRNTMSIANGGGATAVSYANANIDPMSHYEFLKNLPIMHREGQYLFVHAGFFAGAKDWEDVKRYRDMLIWNRSYNDYEGEWLDNVFVVHGHTPTRSIQVHANQLGIDTGAVFGNKLTAVRLYEDRGFEAIQVQSSFEY